MHKCIWAIVEAPHFHMQTKSTVFFYLWEEFCQHVCAAHYVQLSAILYTQNFFKSPPALFL